METIILSGHDELPWLVAEWAFTATLGRSCDVTGRSEPSESGNLWQRRLLLP